MQSEEGVEKCVLRDAYKANARAWRRALYDEPVCSLSQEMNWVMVKVSGSEPEGPPAGGAGAGEAEAAGLLGVAGAGAGAAEVAAGAEGLAGLGVAVAEGSVGVAGEEPEAPAAMTLGPGMV